MRLGVGLNDRTAVGAYRIRPPNIPQGMNVPPRYVHSAPFGGVWDASQVCRVPGMRHAGASGTPAKFTRGVCGSSRKSLGVCRGVCASSAGSLGIYRGVCASGASLSAFAAAFAQAAQVSRCLPWRLRRRRGVSRHLPRRLRKRRKSLGVCRGVCAGSASLSAFARPGFLTALPRAGRWGVCWASSRRPTRGERRRRRGLHSARSAGC